MVGMGLRGSGERVRGGGEGEDSSESPHSRQSCEDTMLSNQKLKSTYVYPSDLRKTKKAAIIVTY